MTLRLNNLFVNFHVNVLPERLDKLNCNNFKVCLCVYADETAVGVSYYYWRTSAGTGTVGRSNHRTGKYLVMAKDQFNRILFGKCLQVIC